MASRKIEDLVPEMQVKVKNVIKICKDKGVDILFYCTLRSLEEQAKLYRQSRTRSAINVKLESLRERGFGFLADIVESVGPCSGPHVTNACAGESWHNYAEAGDGVPLINGKAAWSYKDNKEAWDIYGAACVAEDLDWAGNWTRFKEMPHTQLRVGGNPLKIFSPEDIKEILINNGLLT